jgi:hypothetical protein
MELIILVGQQILFLLISLVYVLILYKTGKLILYSVNKKSYTSSFIFNKPLYGPTVCDIPITSPSPSNINFLYTLLFISICFTVQYLFFFGYLIPSTWRKIVLLNLGQEQ